MASGPINHGKQMGETVPNFIWGAPKSPQMVIAAMKLKEEKKNVATKKKKRKEIHKYFK